MVNRSHADLAVFNDERQGGARDGDLISITLMIGSGAHNSRINVPARVYLSPIAE